jgi:hypothetical protein
MNASKQRPAIGEAAARPTLWNWRRLGPGGSGLALCGSLLD